MTICEKISPRRKQTMKIKYCDNNIYADYIIIGSGAAGATFAKILTDDRKHSAVVLEAGEYREDDALIKEARYNRVLLSDYWPEYGWQGMSKIDPFAANRNFMYPQTGRIAGGSTAINNMNMVKASPANVQRWANYLGDFWSVENMYKAYKEAETFIGTSSEPATRGEKGAIVVTQFPQNGVVLEATQKIVDAMAQVTGLGVVQDYNAPSTPLGQVTNWQIAEYPDGTRSYSVTGYLNDKVVVREDGVMKGVNGRRLAVLFRAQAQKILFHHRKASGVAFVRDGQCYTAHACKHVILAAGLLSAQLLQVSGIGPADVLEEAGIEPVYINENVGRNYNNHTLVEANFLKPANEPLTDPLQPGATMTTASLLPDPSGIVDQNQRGTMIYFQDGLIANSNGQPNPAVMAVTAFQLDPHSRGVFRIDSKDPLKNAIVQYNYLEDERDVQFYVDFFRKVLLPFAKAIEPQGYTLTAPTENQINDDAALLNYIRTSVRQTHHGYGTVRMAPNEDEGVVDKYGRVFGVKKLVCFDTSVLPFSVDGNNQFTVFAGALRLAKLMAAKHHAYDN